MNDEGNWITIGGQQDGQGKVKVEIVVKPNHLF